MVGYSTLSLGTLEMTNDQIRGFVKSKQGPASSEAVSAYLVEEAHRVLTPLLALLGDDLLFIPEYRQEKRPRLVGWNKLIYNNLPSHYDKALADSIGEGGNLGILLGAPSGNICAIDLDRDLAVEPFLGENPRLRETLCTTGSGIGAQFWVRMRGRYEPKVLKISVTPTLAKKYNVTMNPDTETYDVGEWRGAQKSTIWGVHPNGKEYRMLVERPVIEVKFTDIILPLGWRLRKIRPTEFGPAPVTEDDLINSTAEGRREKKKWRGGGGSH
jgi:hypothetical protein